MKTTYNGDKGIEITFNTYQIHEDGEITAYRKDYIDDLKKRKIPLKSWIDPVYEIKEDDKNFVVYNASYSYHYLKSEIKEYKFYDTEYE